MTSVAIGRKKIIPLFNIYETPVWYFVAYTAQDNILPFMIKTNIYTDYESVSSVIIDNVNYNVVQTLAQCRDTPATWVQIDGIVYAHFVESSPEWLFQFRIQSVLRGFTNGLSYADNGLFFNTGFLKYIPAIKEEADDMEYSKMKFKSESIELINKDGMFDSVYDYLGADMFIYIDKTLEYKLYIKNVKIKIESVIFVCGDIRERFQGTIPDKKFDAETYPFIGKNNIGKDIQEVFGYCEWVPCVCVDELDIVDAQERELPESKD
jgi:hypothetical protein